MSEEARALQAFGHWIALRARCNIGAARWAKMTPKEQIDEIIRRDAAILDRLALHD